MRKAEWLNRFKARIVEEGHSEDVAKQLAADVEFDLSEDDPETKADEAMEALEDEEEPEDEEEEDDDGEKG